MRDQNKDYQVNIDSINIVKHEYAPNGAIIINWLANIGFGQWEATLEDDGKLHVYTECMDSQDDKLFSKQLLEALLNDIIIEG